MAQFPVSKIECTEGQLNYEHRVKPTTCFFLGVISTIAISVFGNLIKPDGKTLIEILRNWFAELSKKRAIARIDILNKEISKVSEYVKSLDATAAPI